MTVHDRTYFESEPRITGLTNAGTFANTFRFLEINNHKLSNYSHEEVTDMLEKKKNEKSRIRKTDYEATV